MSQKITSGFYKALACILFLFSFALLGKAQKGQGGLTIPCPVTDAGPDKTICPLPGSVQIGIPGTNGISYSWSPQTGLDNPFLSNPIASPTTTTTYTLTTLGNNLISNGDFSQGNMGFGSDYTYLPFGSFVGTQAGSYSVVPNPQYCVSDWCNLGENNILVVDGKLHPLTTPIPAFWNQHVAVQSNTNYLLKVTFYAINPLDATYVPSIQITVNNSVILNNYALPYNSCNAVTVQIPVSIPANTTDAFIEMKSLYNNGVGQGPGNDFAVDDISLQCKSTDAVPVTTTNTCPPPCTPPIQISGMFSGRSSCPGNDKAIIPYTQNYYCYSGDCFIGTYLESNYAAGNEWYINDILINGSGGNIPTIGLVNITNNSQKLSFNLNGSTVGQSFKFQVKNTSQGCNQLTTPTYVYTAVKPYYDMGLYKPDFTKTYNTFPYNSAGPGSIYTWSVPGTIITDVDPTTPEASIYFPSTISLSGVSGTITVTNSPYCNGIYPINFSYSLNAFKDPSINNKQEEKPIQSNSNVHPNPASSQTTITSTEPITDIEITDLQNPITKKIKLNPTKNATINISDLKPGIYNCKITTTKGIQYQKLVIRR